MWNQKGQILKSIDKAHADWITKLIELRNGRICSSSYDKTIKIWNSNGDLQQTFTSHSNSAINIFQMRDGKIMSCGRDHTIKIWK